MLPNIQGQGLKVAEWLNLTMDIIAAPLYLRIHAPFAVTVPLLVMITSHMPMGGISDHVW